jgi:hypothetical protein
MRTTPVSNTLLTSSKGKGLARPNPNKRAHDEGTAPLVGKHDKKHPSFLCFFPILKS